MPLLQNIAGTLMDLSEKHVLIVNGSLLAEAELRAGLIRRGARVTVTKNLVSAFELVAKKRFDGAVVDHSLHNAAFDLCTELQATGIPYISANIPHRLQGLMPRQRDAEATVLRLANLLETEAAFSDEFMDFRPANNSHVLGARS